MAWAIFRLALTSSPHTTTFSPACRRATAVSKSISVPRITVPEVPEPSSASWIVALAGSGTAGSATAVFESFGILLGAHYVTNLWLVQRYATPIHPNKKRPGSLAETESWLEIQDRSLPIGWHREPVIGIQQK